MPEKRPSPLLEIPPDASSSSDDEMEEVVEEEEEVKSVDNEEDIEEDIEEEEEEEEDEEEEEEEEEEDGDASGFTVKKHVAPSPQPQSSSAGEEEEDEEEEESDSESGSDSDLPPKSTRAVNTVIDPSVKPITSIPMDGNAKLKKSTEKPKPTVTPAKRPAKTTTDKQQEDSKRRKKSGGGDVEESEKKSSNKLWSEDDEVVILKGMVSLIKKGAKPTSDMNVLLEQIKDGLHVDVTREQLHNKIRRLKQKYQGNLKREGEGEELQFLKAHDSKCYELSKKVWGEKYVGKVEGTEASNGVVDSVKKQVKSRSRKPTTTNAAVVSPNLDTTVVSPNEVSTLAEKTPNLSTEPYFNEIIDFGKNSLSPPEGLKGFLAKEGLQLIGSTKAKALEERWRKLQIAEAKIYLERVELVREQLKMVVDAVGSPEE